ncbi:MAG: flagellar biosynthesis protein FlhF [Lachnospiraceae bacterium]|nr:flagellar biosynthesis protein FlhF [Lachnospiraceae bacterium]
MIIKKFQGKTEAEATENARKELGTGVVVMNARNIKRKGLFSFFRPQLVEVTVALEEDNQAAAQAALRTAAKKISGESGAAQTGKSGDDRKVEELEEKLDHLQTLLMQMQIQKEETAEEKRTEEKQPEENEEKDEAMARFLKLLYRTMTDNEVDEKYINQIMEEIERVHKPGMPFDYALENSYQKLILKFGMPVGITPASKGPKVVFFIGPTGVGKTTTIAKIASKFSVEDKKKVALLTGDTYRIAAAEQLRTYAGILEVPFRVVYTVEEVENAIRDFQDYDYIFVDTAGHSHQNRELKETISAFIECVEGLAEKEIFLVVSATTKYRDLINIADSYKEIADYKLVFTKLDETIALGNLLNLKLHTGAALSYVTCGQNVPDDIEEFNPQKTVKQLLGGKR